MSSPYIDPGSGALLWQILVVSFLTVSYRLRSSIDWIKDRYRKRKK